MRAMEVLVEVVDRVVVVAEVPAVDVVDVAVEVIVDAIGLATAAQFAGVRPGAVSEVRVAEVDPVVDDRHDRGRVAGRDTERLPRVDVGIDRAAGVWDAAEQILTEVLEAPQLVPERFPGRVRIQEAAMVDANALDVRVGAEARESLLPVPGRSLERYGSGVQGLVDLSAPDARRSAIRAAGVVPSRNVTISRSGSSAVGGCQAGPMVSQLGRGGTR